MKFWKTLFKNKKTKQINSINKLVKQNNYKETSNIEKINDSELQELVLNIIVAENKYITGRQIINKLEKKINYRIDPISLRKIIASLRKCGNPIIANCYGYYRANSAEEVLLYRKQRLKEIRKEIDILNGLDRWVC